MGYYLRGEIAKLVNINIETLRFYEKIHLISIPVRSENGYRQYSEEDLIRLQLILQLKECGFSVSEIRTLFPIDNPTEICLSDVLNFIDKKVQDIDNNILKLQNVKSLLLSVRSEVIEPKCPQMQKFINEHMKIKQQ